MTTSTTQNHPEPPRYQFMWLSHGAGVALESQATLLLMMLTDEAGDATAVELTAGQARHLAHRLVLAAADREEVA